jgi:hypothetical protein
LPFQRPSCSATVFHPAALRTRRRRTGSTKRLVTDTSPRAQPVPTGLHAPRQLDRRLAGATVRVLCG